MNSFLLIIRTHDFCQKSVCFSDRRVFVKLRGNGNVLRYYCNISQICGDKVWARSVSVNDILYISLRYIVWELNLWKMLSFNTIYHGMTVLFFFFNFTVASGFSKLLSFENSYYAISSDFVCQKAQQTIQVKGKEERFLAAACQN